MNPYYNSNGVPLAGAPASARVILSELRAIALACDQLPPLSGLGNRIVSMPPGSAQMDHQTYVAGSWTPAFHFGVEGDLSVTYSTQVGHYIRFGAFVFAAFNIVTSAFTHTTSVGLAYLSGMPSYYCVQNGYAPNPAYVNYTKAGYTQSSFSIGPSSNYVFVHTSGTGVTTDRLQAADLPSGTNLTWSGSFMYYTNTTP